MNLNFSTEIGFAKGLDRIDPLAEYRNKFLIPKHNQNKSLYFTGNSLGLQPKITAQYISEVLGDWAKYGVEGHLMAQKPWLPYHEFVAKDLANVVGALESEVVAMGSLTANLHFLMVSFYRPEGKKRKIVIEKSAFPSDIYAVKSQIKYHGGNPETDLIILQPDKSDAIISEASIIKLLNEQKDEIALVLIGGVNYYSGQAFDMQMIALECRKLDIVCGFDLAHAAGNLKLELHEWAPDFAAWCSYKYLNAGPGAIAGIFIHQRHHGKDLPRFEGWWGHNKETRFLMGPDFEPINSAEAWQHSNPPIFQLAALRASLSLFAGAGGMTNLRKKSIELTSYLEFMLENIGSKAIEIITPKEVSKRGCQLSIRVKKANKSVYNAITKEGVIADWREPDVIRVAPVPLYNSFEDVYQFTQILAKALKK